MTDEELIAAKVVPCAVQVRRMVAEVEDALLTQTPPQVAAQFPEYQKKFPKLFSKIIDPKCPRALLAMMVDQIEKMENDSRKREVGDIQKFYKKTEHSASVAVGTVLVDTIVKPQLAGVKPDKMPMKK
jgi:hypothetical protein